MTSKMWSYDTAPYNQQKSIEDVQATCIISIFSISCLRDKTLWCKVIHIYICLRLSNVSLGVRITLDVMEKEISGEIGWYEHWVCQFQSPSNDIPIYI